MLSGKVPFQSKSAYEPSAMAIARSIMDGSISFEGDEWTHVSGSAKNLILGMVTLKFRVFLFFDFLAIGSCFSTFF